MKKNEASTYSVMAAGDKNLALSYFEEDIVYTRGRHMRCGTVLKSYDTLDSWDDDSSDSSSELRPGEVKVAVYPSGTESLLSQSKVRTYLLLDHCTKYIFASPYNGTLHFSLIYGRDLLYLAI